MTSGSIPITPALGVVVGFLLVAAAAVMALGGLGRHRAILTAGVRAALQLFAVSLIITQVVRSFVLVVLFIVVMFAIAARTAGRRITGGPSWWWAFAPIGAGVAPVVAAFLTTGVVPVEGLVLIPLVGQLIGGALTATALAGRRMLDELAHRSGEVEAALALGLSERDSRLEIARPVAGDALLPALDQTRTVGVVTLPGAFVGMLLGGASPIQAGAVQLFVLISLLAVQALAILVVLDLVARGRFVPGNGGERRRWWGLPQRWSAGRTRG